MHSRRSHRLPFLLRSLTAAAGLFLATFGSAQTLFWDLNTNATAGAGTTPSGTWVTGSGGNWNTNANGNGGAIVNWTNGRDAVFSAGTDATGAYTVTVSGTVGVSSINVEEGTPTFTGGTINFSNNTPNFTVASGRTATVGSNLSGTNGLTKLGAGTLVFDTAAKGYTGATTVSAGTLQVNFSESISNSSALSVASGATFILNWGVSETVGSLAGAGTVDFRVGALTVGDANNTTFSGVLQNVYGVLQKQGTGSLTLAGANTYNGITNINAGVLVAASNTALGSSTYGNTIASGAALHLQGDITLTEAEFSVTGTGASGTGAIRNLSGNNTLNGTLDLAGNTTMVASSGSLAATGDVNLAANTLTTSGAGNLSYSGAIYGSGGLTQTGGGTVTFSGTGANSFGGALTINDGTVALAKTAGTNATGGGTITIGNGTGAAGSALLRLDAANQIADYSGLITVNTDGELNLNNFSDAVNTLTSTGRINLGSTGALTVGVNSGNVSLGGSILGTGTLVKGGSGTLSLLSSIVLAGELQLNAGTLALSGFNLTAGTLHITGNSTIDFGGGNSALNVTNFIIDAGVTLTVANWANAADFFYAQGWSGAAYNTTNAAPMNQVAFTGFSAANTRWQSFDNQVTPVPETSTYGAVLLVAVGSLGAVRRLRRR